MLHTPGYWRTRFHPLVWLLLPVTLLFCTITALRRSLYRIGWSTSYRSSVPVVVVGNISVGGTGKTPLVSYLANLLQSQGKQVAIVTRGYGGNNRNWPLPVTTDSDPAVCGDEPLLLAQSCNCPVVADPNRSAAIAYLLQHHSPDVIISDDGLQHYRMARDIEIAVIDGDRRFGNRFCLPAGPLREPVSRLQQVDFRICNGGKTTTGEIAMHLQGNIAINMVTGEQLPLQQLQQVHAVAAIGNPQRFFTHLQQAGLAVTPHPFADHHPFTTTDFVWCSSNDTVVMTSKDAVKCQSFAKCNFWIVPVQAELPDSFNQQFTNRLGEIYGQKAT